MRLVSYNPCLVLLFVGGVGGRMSAAEETVTSNLRPRFSHVANQKEAPSERQFTNYLQDFSSVDFRSHRLIANGVINISSSLGPFWHLPASRGDYIGVCKLNIK